MSPRTRRPWPHGYGHRELNWEKLNLRLAPPDSFVCRLGPAGGKSGYAQQDGNPAQDHKGCLADWLSASDADRTQRGNHDVADDNQPCPCQITHRISSLSFQFW